MDFEEVISFWFEELTPEQWFEKSSDIDQMIRDRFFKIYHQAVGGGCELWKDTPEGTLALIIVLDQFPRNMFRDKPEAFLSDKKALEEARIAIEKGFDKKVERGRAFFYMPFMHSENIDDQKECVRLFSQLVKEDEKMFETNLKYAKMHKDIIQRFGRFPHRNKILGRNSSKEEAEFLQGTDSSF